MTNMGDIQVVSRAVKSTDELQQLHATLKVPEAILLGKNTSISIASTDYLHRINTQLMQTSQQQFDAIANNMGIVDEQFKTIKLELETKKKQQQQLFDQVDTFSRAIKDQFGDIDKNMKKLTAYYLKYGLIKNTVTNSVEKNAASNLLDMDSPPQVQNKQEQNDQQQQKQVSQAAVDLLDF